MKLMLKWGLLAAVLTVFVGATPASALQTLTPYGPASKCLGAKAKCIIKKKSCLLGCHKKALAKAPHTLDTACVLKCHDKFDGGADPAKGCFQKLETKDPVSCGLSLGDTATFEAKIDAHVLDIVAELNPFGTSVLIGPPSTAKCVSGKVGCATKFNACILGLVSKAAAGGIPIDAAKLQKCRDGIKSCIEKLDAKGNDDGDEQTGVLPGGLELCQTVGDFDALQDKDEAFVDDVIAELFQGPNDMNTQRCSGNTFLKCTNAPNGAGGPCTGFGLCQFYFGSHLPLAAGGVQTCVQNQWAGGITGTFNQQTGHSAGTANIIASVYNGISVAQPCPKCINDPFINDGVAAGTCSGGTRNTLGCDGNGQSPEPAFGVTSLDCPPSGSTIAVLPIDLTNTTGTVTKTLAAAGPNCQGTLGDECMCGICTGNASRACFDTATCAGFGEGTCTGVGGEPQKTHACVDSTADPIDGTLCLSTGGGEGACPEGPLVQHCKLETFRSCTVPTQGVDCPTTGDTCGTFTRECFPGYNGVVGETISSTGFANAPRDHAGTQGFASVFCVAPTSASAVNAAGGLPGPGRLRLGGVGQENGTAGTCPTQASFLPTFRGGVLDTGWTGIAHDAKALSGGKVTVSVSGCTTGAPVGGFCGVCTYSGPIANANANP